MLSDELLSLLESRRSVRKYRDEVPSKELLQQLIAAAVTAPSASNKQPWRFLIVTDRARIDRIAIDERLDPGLEVAGRALRSGDVAQPDQHLPLPLRAERLVVAQRSGDRVRQRPAAPGWPQVEVSAVREAVLAWCLELSLELLHPAHHRVVSVAILGLARRLVHEEQIDVRREVQLDAAELAKRIPDCELIVYENCGHCPNIEMAGPFNQAVIDFLNRFHAGNA